VDVNKPLPRFIELILAPQERSEADSADVQRLALESLREVRPGMLIDHIVESPGGDGGPIKRRALFQRLRSHVEARTFDELRVFELGRLIRPSDHEWHEALVQFVYDARAILVDTTGLVADPASEQGGRSRSSRHTQGAESRASPGPTFGRPATGSAMGRPAPKPPPIMTSAQPSWSPGGEDKPRIALPEDAGPPELGRPAPQHIVTSTKAPAAKHGPAPPRTSSRPTHRFFALCEGRLFCPTCAQPMTVQSMGHERRSFYTCASKHLHPATDCQPEVYFPVDVVDKAVWERIATELSDLEIAQEILRDAVAKGAAGGQSRKSQIRDRLERIERDELEVLGLRSEDRISEGAARRRLEEIRKERMNLTAELQDDAGADAKLRPLSKAIGELQAYCRRSGQAAAEADYGLRRRLVEASVPLTAEYGIFPHDQGELEIRDLLAELELAPRFSHKARALGRMVGALRDRVVASRPKRDAEPARDEGPGLLGGLLARLRRSGGETVTESPDLGKALQAAQYEHKPLQISEAPPHRPPWVLYGSLLAAAVLVAVLFQPVGDDGPAYEDKAQELGFGDQLEQLHQVPGGWIAETRPEWVGSHDEQVAALFCASLVEQLGPAPTETITLMVPGGVPVAECGLETR
jgi:hypothetical protein